MVKKTGKTGPAAKTASKNNPNVRQKGGVVNMYNGLEIEPVRFCSSDDNINVMAAQYKKTKVMIESENGDPIAWSDIVN